MLAPQSDEEEFYFYLKLAKPLVLNLSNTNDRIKAAAWIKKLRDDGSNPALRTNYLKLLLFMLQRRRLIGPFAAAPDATALESFPVGSNLQDIAKTFAEVDEEILRETLAQGGYGEWPPYTTTCSRDLTEYAATQEIPNFGTQVYFAISKEPLQTWDKFAEEVVPRAEKVAPGEPDLHAPPDPSPDISSFGPTEEPPPSPAKIVLSPAKTPSPIKEKPGAEKSEKSVKFDDQDKDFAWLDTLGGKDVDFEKLKEEQDKDEFTKEARIPPSWGSNLINVTESPAERRTSRLPSLPYLTPPIKTYRDYMKSVGLRELPFRPKLPKDSLERTKEIYPRRPISPIREHDIFESYPEAGDESEIDLDADLSGISMAETEESVSEIQPTSPGYIDPSAYLQGAFSPEPFSPEYIKFASTPKKPKRDRRILHSSLKLMKKARRLAGEVPELKVRKTKLPDIHEFERFVQTPEKVPPRLPIADIKADISERRVFTRVEPDAMLEFFEQPSFLEETLEGLEDPAAHLQGDILIGEDIEEDEELKRFELGVFGEVPAEEEILETSVTVFEETPRPTITSPARRVSPRRLPQRAIHPEIVSPRRVSPAQEVTEAVQRVLDTGHKPTTSEVARYIDDVLKEHTEEVRPVSPRMEERREISPAKKISEAVKEVLDAPETPTADEVAQVIDEAIVEEEEMEGSFIEESKRDYKWMADLSGGPGLPLEEEQDSGLWESFGWWTEDPDVIFDYLPPTPIRRPSEEYVSRFPAPPPTPPLFSRDPRIREGLAGRRIYAPEEFGIGPFEEPFWTPAEMYFRRKQEMSPFRDPRDIDRETLQIVPLKSPEMKTRLTDVVTGPGDLLTDVEEPELYDVPLEEGDLQKMTKAQAMFEAYKHGKTKPLTDDEKASLVDPEQLDWSKFNFFTDKPPRFILEPTFFQTPPKYDPNVDIVEEDLDESISHMIEEELEIISAKLPVTTPQRSPFPRRPLLPETLPEFLEIEEDIEILPSPEMKTPPRYQLPRRKEVKMDEKLPTRQDQKIAPEPKRRILYKAPGVTEEDIEINELYLAGIRKAERNYYRRLEILNEIREQFVSPPERLPSPPPEPHLLDASITEEVVPALVPPSGWVYTTPPQLRKRPKLHEVISPRAPVKKPEPVGFSEDVGLFYESPPEAAYSPTMVMEPFMESPETPPVRRAGPTSPIRSPGGRPIWEGRPADDIIKFAEDFPDVYADEFADEDLMLYESPERPVTPEYLRRARQQEVELGMRPPSPKTMKDFEEQMIVELEQEVFAPGPPLAVSPPREAEIRPVTPESPVTPELERKLWRQTLALHQVQPVQRKRMRVRPKPGKAVLVSKAKRPSLRTVTEQIAEEAVPPEPRERMFIPARTRVPVVTPSRLRPTLYATAPPSPDAKYVDYGIGSPIRYEPRKILPLVEREEEPDETDFVSPERWRRTDPRRRLFTEPESPELPIVSEISPEKPVTKIQIDTDGRIVVSSPIVPPSNWDWQSPPSYKQKMADIDYYGAMPSSPLASEAPPRMMYSPEEDISAIPLVSVAEGEESVQATEDIFDYYATQAGKMQDLEAEVLPELDLSFEIPKTEGVPASITNVKIVTSALPTRTVSVIPEEEVQVTESPESPEQPVVVEQPAPVEKKRIKFSEEMSVKLISPKKQYGTLGPQKVQKVKIQLPPPPSPRQPSPRPAPVIEVEPPPVEPPPEIPEYVQRVQITSAAPSEVRISPTHPLLIQPAPYAPPPAHPLDTGIDIGSPLRATPPRRRTLYRAPGVTDEQIHRTDLFHEAVEKAARNYHRRLQILNEIRDQFVSPPERLPSPPPEPHLLDASITEEVVPALVPPSGWVYSTPPQLRKRPKLHEVTSPRAPVKKPEPVGFSEDVGLFYESPPEAAYSPTMVMEPFMESPETPPVRRARPASPIRSPGGRPIWEGRPADDIIKFAEDFPDVYADEFADEDLMLYESPERPVTPEYLRRARQQEVELGMRPPSPKTMKDFEEQMIVELEQEVFAHKPPLAVSPPREAEIRPVTPESPETPELERKIWRQTLALHQVKPVQRKRMRVRPKPGKAVLVSKAKRPSLRTVTEQIAEEAVPPEPRERMFIPARTRVPVVTPSRLRPTLYATAPPSPDAKYVDYGIGSPIRYEPRKILPLVEREEEPDETDFVSPERWRRTDPRRRLFTEPESPEQVVVPQVSPERHKTKIRIGPDGQISVSPPIAPPENWDWQSPPSYKEKMADIDYYGAMPSSPLAAEAPPRALYAPETVSPPTATISVGSYREAAPIEGGIFDYYAADIGAAHTLEAEELPEVDIIIESPSKVGEAPMETERGIQEAQVPQPAITVSFTEDTSITTQPSEREPSPAVPKRKISFADEMSVKLISPKKQYGTLGPQKVQKVKIQLPPPPPSPGQPSPRPAPVIEVEPPPVEPPPEIPEYVQRVEITSDAPSQVRISPTHPLLIQPAPYAPPPAHPLDTGIDIGSPLRATPPRRRTLYRAPGVTDEQIHRTDLFHEAVEKAARNYHRRLQILNEIRDQFVSPPERLPSPPPEPHLLDASITEEVVPALVPPSGWVYSTPPQLRKRPKLHEVTSPRAPVKKPEPVGFSEDVGLFYESPPEAAYSPTMVMEPFMESPETPPVRRARPASPIRSPGGRPIWEGRPADDIIKFAEDFPDVYADEFADEDLTLYESPERPVTPEYLRRAKQQEIELGMRPPSPKTVREYEEQQLRELERQIFEPRPRPAVSPPRDADIRAVTPESPETPELERKLWRQTLELHQVKPVQRKRMHVHPKPGKAVLVSKAKRPSLGAVSERRIEEEVPPEPRERMFIPAYTREPVVTPARLRPTLYATRAPSPDAQYVDYGIGSPIRYEPTRRLPRIPSPSSADAQAIDYMGGMEAYPTRPQIVRTRKRLTFDDEEEEYEKEKIEELRRLMEEAFMSGTELTEEEEPQVLALDHAEISLLGEIDFEPARFDIFATDEDEEYEGRLPFEGQPDTIFDTSMIDTDLPPELMDFKWVDMRRRY